MGVAAVLAEFPAEVVPGIGAVCKTLLIVEGLVHTARSNKDELAVLLELCDVVSRGALDRCSNRSGEFHGLTALAKHVDSVKDIAERCNYKGGRLAALGRVALSRKISKDIAAVRANVRDFATANNFALNTGLHVSYTELCLGGASKYLLQLPLSRATYEVGYYLYCRILLYRS